MRKLVLLFAFLPSVLFAGNGSMNFSLARKSSNPALAEKEIFVLVKGNPDLLKAAVDEYGGTFRYSSGDISSIAIKAKYIRPLGEKNFIQKMEDIPYKNQALLDTALVNTNANLVHSGSLPLTQPYRGDDVIVGFVDTGLDVNHPDFKDGNGDTRVLYYWDQLNSSGINQPAPYNYGREWTSTEINGGTWVPASSNIRHGTNVAGIAVGNGLAVNHYTGMAPNANIVVVTLDFSNDESAIDGVNYIYTIAQLQNKPCVINASIGNYFGSHDGKDLQAQLIHNMITAQNRRSLVAAAGNYGNVAYHLGYAPTVDTSFTWNKYDSGQQGVLIEFWADVADLANVEFGIGANLPSPDFTNLGSNPLRNISSMTLNFLDTSYFILNSVDTVGLIISYAELDQGTYYVGYFIETDSTHYLWRFMTKGSGWFDSWSLMMESTNLPSVAQYPDIIYYKTPDTQKTTVSSFQCLNSVITVGNYVNRVEWPDYNSNPVNDTVNTNKDIHRQSSRGPTRDNRTKPDIAAPGSNIYTATSTYNNNNAWWIANQPQIVAPGGMHLLQTATSFSTPVVTGAAALYFQMYPNADYQDVISAVQNCAIVDAFTGTVPNNTWGYGKINAFDMLVGCAPVSSVSNSGKAGFTFQNFPNPFTGKTVFVYDIRNAVVSSNGNMIIITDVLGKKIASLELKELAGQIEFSGESLGRGIYFYTLSSGGNTLGSKKMVVY